MAFPVNLPSADGTSIITIASDGSCSIVPATGKLGFYGLATPIVLQTGVAVTAGGIHAALVNLNLITA